MPVGPYSALWPGNASKSIGVARRSIGTTPADWAASTRNRASVSRTIAAIAAIGCTVPSTFDAWVIATSDVLGVIAFLIASGSTYPFSEATLVSVITPDFSSATNGLLIELCSRSVVMT